jgi:hypothetical protein
MRGLTVATLNVRDFAGSGLTVFYGDSGALSPATKFAVPAMKFTEPVWQNRQPLEIWCVKSRYASVL